MLHGHLASSSNLPIIIATVVGPFVGAGVGGWIAYSLQRQNIASQVTNQRHLLQLEHDTKAIDRVMASLLGDVARAHARTVTEYQQALVAKQWNIFVEAVWTLAVLVRGVVTTEVASLNDSQMTILCADAVSSVSSVIALWPVNQQAGADLDVLDRALGVVDTHLTALRGCAVRVERDLRGDLD